MAGKAHLTLLERVALVFFALYVFSAGTSIGSGEEWWRLPASLALSALAIVIVWAVAVVSARQHS